MLKDIKLSTRSIGEGHPPFIIAEMSGNHNQSLERALEIVEAAAKAGAHALKLQTYKAETMTLDVSHHDFLISDQESLWSGQSLFELYKQAYTPWEWHEPIFKRCKELGMIGFSTPFDATAVDFLESLGVELYKVASFENKDLPLIRKIASTGKPMIVSTGISTIADLDELTREIHSHGCSELVLLKCTSTYPASPKTSHIRTIPHMRDLFKCHVGLSDHTLGVGVAVAAVAMGAVVIEKHFTLRRADGGVDSAFSLEPEELELLVVETRRAWEGLGQIHYGISDEEKSSTRFKRSLYIAADLMPGDILTAENLRIIRPGYGLDPKYYDLLIGKKVRKAVQKGTPVSWELFLE